MGQCCAKPATLHEERSAPTEQRNDIKRNFSDRQRAWASTGTVALRDASLQVAPCQCSIARVFVPTHLCNQQEQQQQSTGLCSS